MSFSNTSLRAQIRSNDVDIAALQTSATNLGDDKQDNIVISTDLTMGDMLAANLSYDDTGSQSYKNVKTEIDSLNSKLNSTTSILTSSIESADQEYNLDTLLERVVTNKVKLETFVNELDGAVGDGNSGVVSLMEQVAQNKADGAAEVVARGTAVTNLTSTVTANASLQISDNAARETAIALINSTNTHQYIVDGEGTEPAFTTGSSPMDDNFGIPVLKAGSLQQIHYLAKTPDASLTSGHTMTIDVEVWNAAGSKISTSSIPFVDKMMVHTFGTAVTLPEQSNIVLKYKSKVGTYHDDSRFRLALQVL
jgi:hypothetical protein